MFSEWRAALGFSGDLRLFDKIDNESVYFRSGGIVLLGPISAEIAARLDQSF
jgi:hypothetical protein